MSKLLVTTAFDSCVSIECFQLNFHAFNTLIFFSTFTMPAPAVKITTIFVYFFGKKLRQKGQKWNGILSKYFYYHFISLSHYLCSSNHFSQLFSFLPRYSFSFPHFLLFLFFLFLGWSFFFPGFLLREFRLYLMGFCSVFIFVEYKKTCSSVWFVGLVFFKVWIVDFFWITC